MSDLDFAKVVYRLGIGIGDTTSDPDDKPDVIWCDGGRVLITPKQFEEKVAEASSVSPVPFTMGQYAYEAEIDADGYLTDANDNRFLWVIDLTSEKLNPRFDDPDVATHTVSFTGVTATIPGGPQVTVDFKPRDVRLTKDGLDGSGVNDLTLVSPVVPGTATPIYQGPRGVGVADATIAGGTNLEIELTDGSTVDAGALPVGPGGSDSGVAGYLGNPATATSVAAGAAAADDTHPLGDAVAGVVDAHVPAASAATPGKVELATNAETTTGTDTTRAVTPAGVKAVLDPIRDLSDATLAGNLTATFVQSKLPKVSGRANGLKYDGTDETATLNGILAAIAAFGVAELTLEGLVRCDGQVVVPDTGGSIPTQAPLRITGAVAYMTGTTFSGAGPAPDAPGLDLRYAGRTDTGCGTTLDSAVVTNANASAGDRGLIVTGPGIADWSWILAVEPGVSWTLSRPARATGTVTLKSFGGRIQGLGYGTLEIDHLQHCNNGSASSAPFVLTTGPTVKIHDNIFIGHSTKGSGLCDEDVWVGGGPGQGTALTSALTSGTSYTTLAVDPLPVQILAGHQIDLNPGGRAGATQQVVVAANAARGATSITVTSFTANANYGVRTGISFGDAQNAVVQGALDVPSAPFQGYGSVVRDNAFHRIRRIALGQWCSSVNIDNNAWMHTCGSNLAKAPSTLTSALTSGSAYTSLAVSALSIAANVGDVLQLGAGATSQEVVVATAAAAGATSVTVASFTANATYSTGTKVFNTTAGVGAALASFADDIAVNTINARGNRFGMSGGYSSAFRAAGATFHCTLIANDIQDVQADANYLAAYRFDRGAKYNLIIPGLGAASDVTVDDWSDAAHVWTQTVVEHNQSQPSRFPQGVTLGNRLTVKDPTSDAFLLQDTAGATLLSIGGAGRQWSLKGALFLDGNSAGEGTTSITLGNASTAATAVITLKPGSGKGGQIQWTQAGANTWLLYDAASTTLFLRDSVNGKMHVTYTPGAGAGGGSTAFDSAVKIVGNVGFYNTTPIAKQTLAAAATDAATTQTLANDIRTKLIALGLMS